MLSRAAAGGHRPVRPCRRPSPRAVAIAALLVLPALACARIEPPPGGPVDRQAPRLLSVTPDSMAILPGFDGEVSFNFNEVVSEGGTASEGLGTGDLERLVLLSPTDKVPDVQWKRNRITVRPRGGWRPNTVYRVELQPGITDLRTNRATGGSVLTFTTGAPAPDYTLRGRVYDWSTAQPARAVLLEAILMPDSLPYRSLTDSSGSYAFGPLPRGAYLVMAVADQNRDRKRSGREAFDSVRVQPDTGSTAEVPELWIFQHDSLPPRLQPPTVLDSLSLSLPFNQKLAPDQPLDSTMVQVWRLPDTTIVPVVSLLTAAGHDSTYRVTPPAAPGRAGAAGVDSAMARADTGPARRDTTPQAAGDSIRAPRIERPDRAAAPSRPPLSDKLSVRLGQPLVPGTSYTVLVRGIRNASRVVADSARAGFRVPERPKPTARDTLRMLQVEIDSAFRAGDTLRLDSLRQLLPDSMRALPVDSLLKRLQMQAPPPGLDRPGVRPDLQRPAKPETPPSR